MKSIKRGKPIVGFLYFTIGCLFPVIFLGCQTVPTQTQEMDLSQAGRSFKEVKYGVPPKVVLRKAVYVDTRERFAYNMARTPRSFHFSPQDWQLFNYKGEELQRRKRELQRRLAINGVDPYVNIIIVTKEEGGRGEAQYATAVLMALGLEKISVMSDGNLSKAMIRGARVETTGNLPYWQRKMKHNFSCAQSMVGKARKVGPPLKKDGKPLFSETLLKLRSSAQSDLKLTSGRDFFAYGLALELIKRGQSVCVEDPFQPGHPQ